MLFSIVEKSNGYAFEGDMKPQSPFQHKVFTIEKHRDRDTFS